MKKLIVIVLFFCFTLSAFSQTVNNVYANRQFASDLFQMDEYIKRQKKGVEYSETDTYTGTPYNNPNFLIGNIYKDNELWATNIAIRYNASEDEMEIKESIDSPDEDARVLTKSPDIFVKILGDIFIFAPYKGGVEGGGYFEVLVEGDKFDLYKKWVKKYKPAVPANTTLTKDVKANFKDDPIFYLVNKKGVFFELPASKNKKLKALAKEEPEVKNYVRKYDLNLNEEKDLVRVIKYFNSL